MFPHPTGVVIGHSTIIGDHVYIGGGVLFGHTLDNTSRFDGQPNIGGHVWIGAHAVLLGPIAIGNGATSQQAQS